MAVQVTPTATAPIVRHLHIPGSPFALYVNAGPSYPPNAWGHETFLHWPPAGEEEGSRESEAGRLEDGLLVAGPHADDRRFVFFDRDAYGNRRVKGGESWTVFVRGIALAACPHIQERVLAAVLQACPGESLAGLGVGRGSPHGGMYNLSMGVCDRRRDWRRAAGGRREAHAAAAHGGGGSSELFVDRGMRCLMERNAVPCEPAQCCGRTHERRVCANRDRCVQNRTRTRDWTRDEMLAAFFRYSAAGCPPLEKLGRDAGLLPGWLPCGASDDQLTWAFPPAESPGDGERGGGQGTPDWVNVTGYVEVVSPAGGHDGAGGGGAVASAFRVEDLDDGSYELRYALTAAGLYHVSILGEDTQLPVHGAPYHVLLEPGRTHPESVGVNLDSVVATPLSQVVAGESAALDLSLRDRHGNRRWSWEGAAAPTGRPQQREPGHRATANVSELGSAFNVSLRPMQVMYFDAVRGQEEVVEWTAAFDKLTWQEYGGGLVRADYTITTAGRYVVDIALNGRALGPSSDWPVLVVVRPGPTDLRASTVVGAIAGCEAGVQCQVHVEVRDAWGNRRLLEEDSSDVAHRLIDAGSPQAWHAVLAQEQGQPPDPCHADGLLHACVPSGPSCLDPATGEPSSAPWIPACTHVTSCHTHHTTQSCNA